jgi:hypothetical protein
LAWAFNGLRGSFPASLDDGLVLTVAVVTLGHHKLQEQEGRWLKRISGMAMLGLAVVLIAKPERLAA